MMPGMTTLCIGAEMIPSPTPAATKVSREKMSLVRCTMRSDCPGRAQVAPKADFQLQRAGDKRLLSKHCEADLLASSQGMAFSNCYILRRESDENARELGRIPLRGLMNATSRIPSINAFIAGNVSIRTICSEAF